ncbi:TolC family protein [Pedobacter sp. L105]|uniref:TolC family protein n=1 Tax=Pedobacter sp. L105 TaxID=1641871 RepID=UPI00131B11A9|nr:TolC family protein [Pedobacter sp. L105]
MKFTFAFIAILLILFKDNTNAQTEPLVLGSLQEVIARAIKNNPTQAIYQQQIKQAIYNHRASNGFMYPNVSGSFNGQDNLHLAVTPIPGILINQPGTTYYAQFGKKFTYNTGLTLNENIFDWSAILQSSIAKNNIMLTQLQQTSYIQSLKDQTAKLYFSILVGKASLKVSNQDLALADSLVMLSKQRLKEGSTDALSVNQAMINYNNVLQNQAQSQQMYNQGIENLKIILGEKAVTELSLTEQLNIDSINNISNISMGADKSIDVYRQQLIISTLQSREQRSAAYPKLGFNGYLGAQQFRNDFGLGFGNGAWTGYRYLGLSLNVPIFTGLTNTNKYRSSLVQQQIADMQYKTAAEQSAVNDRLLLENYSSYTHITRASANSYLLYRANVSLNSAKYQEGIINMDVYLKAFEDYLKAENTHLTNLSQLLSTQATILSRD